MVTKDSLEALLEAARAVERWYYGRDAMWVRLTATDRQHADEAVIALHDALAALDESGVIEDDY